MTQFEYDAESNETLLIDVLDTVQITFRRAEAIRQHWHAIRSPHNDYAGLVRGILPSWDHIPVLIMDMR